VVSNPHQKLQQRLGYSFQNPDLLDLALCHRSVGNNNNERLEFLGDSILGFIIAEELFKRFPNASEGQMSRMRSHLVKGKTLALLAQDFELGSFLKLGSGEMKSGGHRRASILADAVEAILGGIYLESGMSVSRKIVCQWYGERLDEMSPEAIDKDPKTRLQEWLQARKLALPIYTVTDTHGADHDQTFDIHCLALGPKGNKQEAKAQGKSRRQAEQRAAETLLQRLEGTK